MGKNEHKHKDNKINKKQQQQQKNRINSEEKTNTTTNKNDMKKSASTTAKECQTKIMRKAPEQRSSNQKYLTCQAKHCPGIKLIFFETA